LRPYVEKPITKGLVEWLKVQALSSNSSTAKTKTKTKKQNPQNRTKPQQKNRKGTQTDNK
jgi:hypothetical protein